MDNFNIQKFFRDQYLTEGVNDNITKSNISNLDYDAIKYIFPEISTSNRISFPNPDDSLRAVGNERDWEDWKKNTMERYGDVELEMDPNNSMWFRRVKINDKKFNDDKNSYTQAKSKALERDSARGWSIDENHDCEKEHPGISHDEYVKKQKDIDTIKMMAPKTDTKALRQIVKDLVAKKKKGIPPNARFTDVEEGTCGYDRDVNGKKLDGPGGLGEDYKGKSEYTEDEVKYSIGVDDDYEGWVDVAFQKGFKYDENKDQWYGPGSLDEIKLKESSMKARELADSYSLKQLQSRYDQIWRDMEEEAEPEGGPIADQYADELHAYEEALQIAKQKIRGGSTNSGEMTYDQAIKKHYGKSPKGAGPRGPKFESTDSHGRNTWGDKVGYSDEEKAAMNELTNETEFSEHDLGDIVEKVRQIKAYQRSARQPFSDGERKIQIQLASLLKKMNAEIKRRMTVDEGKLNEDIDLVKMVLMKDEIAQALYSVDYDQLESDEKERVRDVYDEMGDTLLNESEKSWNAIDVSRTAEKELSNKEWNERTSKKLDMLMKLNAASKFKKDFDEDRLQGWVDQNYSWERVARQFKVNEDKGKLTRDEDLVSTFGKDWVEKFKPLKEKLNSIEKSLPKTMKSSDRINREVS